MIVARPLHAAPAPPCVDQSVQDTLPFDMSPIAKKLEVEFAAHDTKVMELDTPEAATTVATKPTSSSCRRVEVGQDSKVEPAPDGKLEAFPGKGEVDEGGKDDLLFLSDNMTREQQLLARDALVNKCQESEAEDEQPCLKTPAAKARPEAKGKAKAKLRAKAKAKARAKTRAKAKAKGKAAKKKDQPEQDDHDEQDMEPVEEAENSEKADSADISPVPEAEESDLPVKRKPSTKTQPKKKAKAAKNNVVGTEGAMRAWTTWSRKRHLPDVTCRAQT